jgi:hypothetical protein
MRLQNRTAKSGRGAAGDALRDRASRAANVRGIPNRDRNFKAVVLRPKAPCIHGARGAARQNKVLRGIDACRGPMHNDRGQRARGYKIMTTPNKALRTILPIAGWGDTQAADVMFTGGADPVLPTPFRIGAAGAATLAASGLAATELWQVRTGRRQQVTVDLRQATAALRSGHYLQLAGTDVSSERNTIMGFYPTRDGRWSYLHCNFPDHRAAALSVLG